MAIPDNLEKDGRFIVAAYISAGDGSITSLQWIAGFGAIWRLEQKPVDKHKQVNDFRLPETIVRCDLTTVLRIIELRSVS